MPITGWLQSEGNDEQRTVAGSFCFAFIFWTGACDFLCPFSIFFFPHNTTLSGMLLLDVHPSTSKKEKKASSKGIRDAISLWDRQVLCLTLWVWRLLTKPSVVTLPTSFWQGAPSRSNKMKCWWPFLHPVAAVLDWQFFWHLSQQISVDSIHCHKMYFKKKGSIFFVVISLKIGWGGLLLESDRAVHVELKEIIRTDQQQRGRRESGVDQSRCRLFFCCCFWKFFPTTVWRVSCAAGSPI